MLAIKKRRFVIGLLIRVQREVIFLIKINESNCRFMNLIGLHIGALNHGWVHFYSVLLSHSEKFSRGTCRCIKKFYAYLEIKLALKAHLVLTTAHEYKKNNRD